MRTRVALGAVGVVVAGFGALRFIQTGWDNIVHAVVWLVGGVVVHDGVLAPLTVGLTLLGVRLVPASLRARATLALVVLMTVTATAVPVLGRFGERSDNATLLDRHYVVGWLVFAVLVVGATLVSGPISSVVSSAVSARSSRPDRLSEGSVREPVEEED